MLFRSMCEEEGAKAQGFRDHIVEIARKDPLRFKAWQLEALLEAATRKWQAPPRKHGPDLFSIAGEEIPEHLTRLSSDFEESSDFNEEDEDCDFEKVDANFATVNDLFQDALIKMRKAAQSSAAAEKKMKLADEAKRRAHGQMNVFLRDIID